MFVLLTERSCLNSDGANFQMNAACCTLPNGPETDRALILHCFAKPQNAQCLTSQNEI